MPSTPFICCSIGVATDCSIVSASAPVYVVVRLTCGGRICGNCAMGRPTSATTPMRTVRIAITIATIGRLTKNDDTGRDSLILGGGCGRRRGPLGGGLGVHQRAVGDLLNAVDDDAIALFQALRH